MRVLVANKFAFHRGGLERVMFDEMNWLAESGHDVALFSTSHPSNEPLEWPTWFAPYLELGSGGGLRARDKIVAAYRMFQNQPAIRLFRQALDSFKPDVVHVHGIHRQLSPSILASAASRGIPVVQTLHDYHHVCPADVLLYRGAAICEPRRCNTVWYGACVAGRCVRGSWSASVLSAGETGWARLTRQYERGIRRFVSPSVFLVERMKEGGWTIPIDVVPNAVELSPSAPSLRSGFVYAGRLASEKGIEVLLAAARAAYVDVTVAGEGPLGPLLAEQFPEFKFTGKLDRGEVASLVASARAVVVPSRWYENAPMSVLESMGAGVPVVASAIGGIPEQITHETDGLLVEAGDVDSLAHQLRRLDRDADLANRLGEAARRTVADRFSPHQHMEGLIASYVSAGVCL